MRPRDLHDLLTATLKDWSEDKAPRLGAALAYYTVFSLAPLLIIVISITGLVFGREAVQSQIVGQFHGLLGPSGGELIEAMIAGAQRSRGDLPTAILGLATLLVGALGVFGQLREALNTIWEVPPRPGGGLLGQVRSRLASLAMVLAVGFIVLVSLSLTAALGAVGAWIGTWLSEVVVVLGVVNFLLSFGVITVLFALMFRYIPDARASWGDVWIGAAITSLLFAVGKEVIGLYLGRASVGASFGPAGSLVLLLLWVYYSAQIFFLGAEFTQVYANRYGSRIVARFAGREGSAADRPSEREDDIRRRASESRPGAQPAGRPG